jgi:hypothetical protein
MSIVLLGLVLIAVGVALIIKSWDTGWDEVVRALIWHPGSKRAGYLKYLGFSLSAVGVVAILAGLGMV